MSPHAQHEQPAAVQLTLPDEIVDQRGLAEAADFSSLHAAAKRVGEHDGYHDALTGLPNRRWLEDQLQTLVTTHPENFALVMVDLDGLKETNDKYGHRAGDKMIKTAADTLRQNSRTRSETTEQERRHSTNGTTHDQPTYVAVRLGGDEFALLLPGIKDTEQLNAVTQRLGVKLAAGHTPAALGGKLHTEGQSGVALLAEADELMYAQKQARTQEQRRSKSLPKRTLYRIGSFLVSKSEIKMPR